MTNRCFSFALIAGLTVGIAGAQTPVWHQSPVNGHWYSATDSMSWPDAEALAVSWGGHLATVRSQAENDWIATTFMAPAPPAAIWLGYSDEAVEGDWVWSSGEPTTFTNWHPGEPNNLLDEDFCHMDLAPHLGDWNDHDGPWIGLAELVSDDCDSDGIPDLYEMALEPNLDLNGNGVIDACECLVSAYCQSAPNSVGPGATIGAIGQPSIALDHFTLTASGCPATQFGIFFHGPGQQNVPFGDGILCATGPFGRLPMIATDPNGAAAHALDLTPFLPGETRNVQFWYRDPDAGLTGFNLTHGLQVTICE
jgi:hypothetical protein